MDEYEKKLFKQHNYIAGVDEAGRGPLAGPVVAATVILPRNFKLEKLNDSKKLTKKQRDIMFDIINEQALAIGISIVNSKTIDKVNILNATKQAMLESINNLDIKPDYVLIDHTPLDLDIPHESIVKGDSKSYTIAAASVIAKVTRDKIMEELDKEHPEYGFKNHKGYGTKAHKEALTKHGITKYHRTSFKPVSEVM